MSVVCRRQDEGEAVLGASESLKFSWIGFIGEQLIFFLCINRVVNPVNA